VPHELKKALDSMRKATNRSFQPTEFVRQAIAEKLEKEYTQEHLRKHGYVSALEGRKTP